MIKLITVAMALLMATGTYAANYNCPGTCSPTDIQALHDNPLVVDGDNIKLPAAQIHWGTPVVFTKAINIIGANNGNTFIYDEVPKTGSGNTVMFSANIASNVPVTHGRFTIVGVAQDTANANKGTWNISGKTHKYRFHHVNVLTPGTGVIIFDGDIWGVVDHCYFEGAFKQAVQIHHGTFNNSASQSIWGDVSWESPLYLGTNRGIYIEDCTFKDQGEGGCIDGTYGGRAVFRNNLVYNTMVGDHGTEGFRGRGMRSLEIYNCTFQMLPGGGTNGNGVMFTAIFWRSGSGVIWGNNFLGSGNQTGYSDGMQFTVFRANGCSDQSGTPWGRATGSNPWDQNADSNGHVAIDQVGWGKCLDQLRGDNPINQTTGLATWPRNQFEGVYEWDNYWDPEVPNGGHKLNARCDIVQIGREIFADTPLPGYVPFTYPHPLVTQGAAQDQVNVTNPTIEIYSHQRQRLSAYIVMGSGGAVAGYTLHWKLNGNECQQYVPGALRPGEGTYITFPEVHNPQPCDRLTCGTQYEIWITASAQESAHIFDSTLFCD